MGRFRKQIPVLLLALLLCGLLRAAGEPMVALPGGNRREDAATVRAVLSAEQLPMLDRFPALRRADLSGSICYGEMLSWAQAHPEVQLTYTVALPGGLTAASGDTELDLSALDPEQAAQALPLLAYLPALERVDLGEAGQGIEPEQALAFQQAYPETEFDYRFTLFGRDLSSGDSALDLTGQGRADLREALRYLPLMTRLETVELGSDRDPAPFSWEAVAALEAACPWAEFHYAFRLFGRDFALTDTEMDLSHVPVDDEGDSVLQAAACMPRLERLDMDSCGLSNSRMREIRDALPQTEVIWRVWFGDNYSVRTDVKRILASMPTRGGNIDARDGDALSCCTQVRYLDLGHNMLIDDISFVSSMPELRVAILALNNWDDATPLADCPHLEYLEIQTTELSDLSPLAGLKELKHLNICYLFQLTDISPLYGLTQLERLWIGGLDPVPKEQIQHMQELAPDCVINTTTEDPTEGGWRYERTGGFTPRYALLRRQFGDYALSSYSFSWNDPLCW